MDKEYIGDSVYVQHDGERLILTTENGAGPSNTIILEHYVLEALIDTMPTGSQMPSNKPTRGRPITTGSTPIRSIRVPDDEWRQWQIKAARRNRSITQWLRDLACKAK